MFRKDKVPCLSSIACVALDISYLEEERHTLTFSSLFAVLLNFVNI